jgi:hypothetical protein
MTRFPEEEPLRKAALSGRGPTAPVPSGDFDQDGDVDGHDFLVWQRGASPNTLSVGDLADWQATFGSGSLMATNVAVPEPSTWTLLALAVMGSEFTRRRRIGQYVSKTH